MANKKYPKIGLALGSGGAKGLAHIGVLKSFEKHGIPIDIIAGSSIGSFFGAHYARHRDSKKLEEMVMTFSRKSLMELLDFTIKGGLVRGLKTEKFISDMIEVTQFQDLKIPFAAVATDFNTAESIIFTSGNLIKAVRASISVPTFYQPIVYTKRLLADGGLSDPIPVDIAKTLGADITIAVNLDEVYTENILTVIPSISKTPRHAINILQHNLALHSAAAADVIISPKNSFNIGFLGWNYIFDNKKASEIIKSGEKATDEMIPEIQKRIEAYQKRQSLMRKLYAFITRRA
ncbi:MAG: patatin-like phospholipase family protein [Candidatus Levyibacteriota bacterium]